jgi:uncharacterized protein YigE (DUF2233 family)
VPRRRSWVLSTAVAIALVAAGVVLYAVNRHRYRVEILSTVPLGPAAEFRTIRFATPQDRSVDLRSLCWQQGTFQVHLVPMESDESLQRMGARTGAFYAVNGGYFGTDFKPVGLRIIDGVQTSPPSTQRALSGFVTIDSDGAVDLLNQAPTAKPHVNAFQAGPFLIDPDGSIGIHHANDAPAARRTIIATDGADHVLLITTSEVTLYDLALCLHDHPAAFGAQGPIARALNLDGGPSTGMVVSEGSVHVVDEPRGPIREAIVLRKR